MKYALLFLVTLISLSCSDNPLFPTGDDLHIWSTSDKTQKVYIKYLKLVCNNRGAFTEPVSKNKKVSIKANKQANFKIKQKHEFVSITLTEGDSIFVEYAGRTECLKVSNDNTAIFEISMPACLDDIKIAK